MKKLFALFLISIMLLSSCTKPTEQSQETASDTTAAVIPSPIVVPQSKEIEMKVTKGVVVTTKYPYITDAYRKSGQNPKNIDYILRMNLGESDALDEDLFTYKTNIIYNVCETVYWTQDKIPGAIKYYYDFETLCSGIIDNRERFLSFCARSLGVTEEMLNEHFSETHFDDNIVIIAYSNHEAVFLGFDYGFDPLSKTLKIKFSTRPHEGWHESLLDVSGYTAYIVSVAKSDITVDGKLVPYEELNIEVTGNLIAG